jgi:hypothetical protein
MSGKETNMTYEIDFATNDTAEKTMLYMIYKQLDRLRRDVKAYKHPITKEGIVPVHKPQTIGAITSGFFVELDVVTARLYSKYIQAIIDQAEKHNDPVQIISMDGFSNLIAKVKQQEDLPEGFFELVFK